MFSQGDRKEKKKAISNGVNVVSRYGSDEFVVVLSKSTPEAAKKIAQRIITSVSSITTGELTPIANMSIGIACQSDEDNVLKVIEKADRAMYCAKQEDGNRFYII